VALQSRIVALGNDDADRQSPRRDQCEDIGLRQEGEDSVRSNYAQPAPQPLSAPLQFEAEGYDRHWPSERLNRQRALVSFGIPYRADKRIECLSESASFLLFRRP